MAACRLSVLGKPTNGFQAIAEAAGRAELGAVEVGRELMARGVGRFGAGVEFPQPDHAFARGGVAGVGRLPGLGQDDGWGWAAGRRWCGGAKGEDDVEEQGCQKGRRQAAAHDVAPRWVENWGGTGGPSLTAIVPGRRLAAVVALPRVPHGCGRSPTEPLRRPKVSRSAGETFGRGLGGVGRPAEQGRPPPNGEAVAESGADSRGQWPRLYSEGGGRYGNGHVYPRVRRRRCMPPAAMKIGFHTDAFNSAYFSFEKCLAWAQANGLHYIECGLIDGVSWIHGLGYQPHVALYEDPVLLRRKLESFGVQFSQVDAAFPLSGKDGPLRGVPYVMKSIAWAAQVGCAAGGYDRRSARPRRLERRRGDGPACTQLPADSGSGRGPSDCGQHRAARLFHHQPGLHGPHARFCRLPVAAVEHGHGQHLHRRPGSGGLPGPFCRAGQSCARQRRVANRWPTPPAGSRPASR